MTTGAMLVAGVGTLVSVTAIAIAYAAAQRDVDPSEIDPSPQEFFALVGLQWGLLGSLVALGAVAGVIVWGFTPAAIGLRGFTIGSAILGVGAGPALYGFHWVLIKLLKTAGFTFTELFENLTPDTARESGWYVVGVGIQASAEELIFRGALVGALSVALSVPAWQLVVPAAILFGLAHVGRGSGSVISTTAMGLGFGVVFLVGGLVAAALAHVLNNCIGILYSGLFTGDEHASKSNEPGESV
jgi:membrane protease YdiL (CAAX protease family)